MSVVIRDAFRGTIPIGKGLFAAKALKRGEPIAAMNPAKVKRFTKNQWKLYHQQKSLPHDAAIEVRSGAMITDYLSRNGRPRWYRLNHSDNYNTEMHYEKFRIVWKTTRNIARGEELTFKYGFGTEDFINH